MGFSERLQSLRKEKGLSQEGLALSVGVSKHAINSYESGRRTPNANALAALEQFFDVSGDYLLGKTDARGIYKWHDTEYSQVLREGFGDLLKVLSELMDGAGQEEQKYLLTILIELRHVLNESHLETRRATLELTEQVMAATTYYTDTYIGFAKQGSPSKKATAKEIIQEQFSASLEKWTAVIEKLYNKDEGETP